MTNTVIDRNGKMHKRTSHKRIYTHAIIRHHGAWVDQRDGTTHKPYSTATWAGSLKLAQKEARKGYEGDIEILEVLRPATPIADDLAATRGAWDRQ